MDATKRVALPSAGKICIYRHVLRNWEVEDALWNNKKGFVMHDFTIIIFSFVKIVAYYTKIVCP